jgi:hypothetical protein
MTVQEWKLQQFRPTGKQNKYRNKKVEFDGRKFDSLKEAKRYAANKQLIAIGELRNQELQVKYRFDINGFHVCSYHADFVETHPDGRVEVVDTKGFRTKEYIIKRKLMKAIYNIDIKEV